MKKINEDIKNKSFEKAYLLYGNEPYLIFQYMDKIIDACECDKQGMNYTLYRNEINKLDVKEIASTASTMPFFADKRIVVLQDTGAFKAATKADEIVGLIEESPAETILIFVETEIDKRGKCYKAIHKHGYACELNTPEQESLEKWVLIKLKEEGKSITKKTLDFFFEYTNDNMVAILGELEKLYGYTAGRNEITIDDIKAVCSQKIDAKIFSMVDAMSEKNQKATLSYYYDLLLSKAEPMYILAMISRQFNILLQVSEGRERGLSNIEIARAAGVQEFVIRKSLKVLAGFPGKQIRAALDDFATYEYKVKSGLIGDKTGVEMLLIKYSA